MSRLAEPAALARVRCTIAAARRLHTPGDPLGVEARARLCAAGDLSPEGVALALDEGLEVAATDAELGTLVARAAAAPRTWVVASANVCTAAVRALALAVASSPRVLVRPSRRDPVVAELVVRALVDDGSFAAAGGSVALTSELRVAPGDHVHAYGRDETLTAIAAALPEGAVLHGHGTGFGVAVASDATDVEAEAVAIARDVVRFDQRGCLSPRIVFATGADHARALAIALQRALLGWRDRVPPGAAVADASAELTRFRHTMESVGDVFGDVGHLVAAASDLDVLPLPPPARALLVVDAAPEAAAQLLAPVARYVAAIGRPYATSPLARAIGVIAPHARTSSLGEMQRPPLDGPVDLRHLR